MHQSWASGHSQHNGKSHLQTLESNEVNSYSSVFLFEGCFKIKFLKRKLQTSATCAAVVTQVVFTMIFSVFTALSERT